ncbi:3'(2'),5'-bisphosphate nucleotidase CysQ [Marinobacter sp. AL4B]|uniref:3'(2'),5'-bisphosphate nucleotidase CysQ n=1 Tax=Marinobacter sp. AL4B TaxID=2871173 RepID=UPI001CAA7133|nr:3'(2'),5'-bisphosphate nucleotidase CysQ [Marinobacter sp. AL4B]MBZ0333196.1 3'(2'),5'-bisphosphate nucleotidase CysQ [Marinobacter sp. AL4B]
MHYSSILPDVIKIADEASERVLHIYQSDFKVQYKEDHSPITAADMASHETIVKGLRSISRDIPILSEEGEQVPWEERKHWRRFWLIDPIDGTKEFTQRSSEFTVNIALIEDGQPIMGVVTAPALKETYWGINGEGAFKRDRTGRTHRIHVAEPKGIKRVVASKNHLTDETRAFIETLGEHETVQAGSSLKFCRIAEGHADIYPRMGLTCEWDTAAAHAVLLAAGGKVQTLHNTPLQYGKEDILNPHFIAAGSWYF